VIVADQDEPGINHAASVAAKLVAAGCHVDVVRPAVGKDAGEHLEAGHGLGEFMAVKQQLPQVAETS
jgi:hypothetical protein